MLELLGGSENKCFLLHFLPHSGRHFYSFLEQHNKFSYSSAWDSTISVLLAKGKAQHEPFGLQVYFCFSVAVNVSLASPTAGTVLLPDPLWMPGMEPIRSVPGQVPANTRKVPSLNAQAAGVLAGIATGRLQEIE